MKYVLYFLVFFLPALSFADKNGTLFYVAGDKLLNEKQYQELKKEDRNKAECSFRTFWQAKVTRDGISRIRVDILSAEIQIIMFVDTAQNMIEGGPFFKVVAEQLGEQLKLDKTMKKSKMKFGGKKCFTGKGKSKDGKIIQLITRSYRNKRWRIVMVMNEKSLRLKPIRRALAIFQGTFKFLR